MRITGNRRGNSCILSGCWNPQRGSNRSVGRVGGRRRRTTNIRRGILSGCRCPLVRNRLVSEGLGGG